MPSPTRSRLGAASGIAYVLGILSLNSADQNSNLVLGGEVVALMLFVPFLAYLWTQIRANDSSRDWLATTALGAGVVAIAIKLAGVLPAILVEQGDLTPAIGAAFTRFGDLSFMVSMIPMGFALAAVAAIVLRSGVLPAWLGWSAAAIAPLLVANGFDLGSEFGPAFILFLLWTLVTAIVLLRGAVTATTHALGARPRRDPRDHLCSRRPRSATRRRTAPKAACPQATCTHRSISVSHKIPALGAAAAPCATTLGKPARAAPKRPPRPFSAIGSVLPAERSSTQSPKATHAGTSPPSRPDC